MVVKKSRSELKREAIIDAAKQAFKEFGVQATSMDKLAELAQVSKRTVYNHFDSKEALVIFLLAELWNQAMSQIGFEFEEGMPIEEQLRRLLAAELDLVADQEYIDLARVALGHYLFKPEAVQQEMEKFASQETALFKWLSQVAEQQLLMIQDIELAYGQLHSLLKGECFWPQLMQIKPLLSAEEKKALISECVTMFMARYTKS